MAMAPLRSLTLWLSRWGWRAPAARKRNPTRWRRRNSSFSRVSSGQAQVAYQNAAFGFQAQRTAPVFEAAAKEMGLVESPGAELEPPQIEGRTAKIRARVQTKEGKTLPLIVTLTPGIDEMAGLLCSSRRPAKKQEFRRIVSLSVGKAPAFSDAATQPVPPRSGPAEAGEREPAAFQRGHCLQVV